MTTEVKNELGWNGDFEDVGDVLEEIGDYVERAEQEWKDARAAGEKALTDKDSVAAMDYATNALKASARYEVLIELWETVAGQKWGPAVPSNG